MSTDLGDTQPTRPDRTRPSQPQSQSSAGQASPGERMARLEGRRTKSGTGAPPPRPPRRPGRLARAFRRPWVAALLTAFLALFLVTMASATAGWSMGRGELRSTATFEAGFYLLEQYNQALADIDEGNYNLARERLEFIFTENPEFLDVADLWVEVNLILSGTSQPTAAELPTNTPTPTVDPRPKEELLTAAQEHFAARDWTRTIDTLLSLRKADPAFHTAEVDGMFYAALRNRGVQQILEQGLFAGGLYDFSLAEEFGPLDGQALNYREWARLYLYGNAFWYAYPEEAAYYYGQLVGAAPDLRDSSGLSAFYRYSQSLIHLADQIAAQEDWCAASEAYNNALAARVDSSIQATADFVWGECLALTPSPTATSTATSTRTSAPTSANKPTSSATFTPGAATSTNTPAATATTAPTSANTPTPSNTPTTGSTATPTSTPTPSNTPTTNATSSGSNP